MTKSEWLSVWSLARRGRDQQYQALRDPKLHRAVSVALYGCDLLAHKSKGTVLLMLQARLRWAARRSDPLDPSNAHWNCRCRAIAINPAEVMQLGPRTMHGLAAVDIQPARPTPVDQTVHW